MRPVVALGILPPHRAMVKRQRPSRLDGLAQYADILRDRAMVTRQAHNLEIEGSTPSPANNVLPSRLWRLLTALLIRRLTGRFLGKEIKCECPLTMGSESGHPPCLENCAFYYEADDCVFCGHGSCDGFAIGELKCPTQT